VLGGEAEGLLIRRLHLAPGKAGVNDRTADTVVGKCGFILGKVITRERAVHGWKLQDHL
jgi:hypothetical protein